MNRTIKHTAGSAFALALAVSVCLACFTLWLDQANDENMQWVAHTQEVLRVLNQAMARTYQAESSLRGFLLTDIRAYQDHYREYTNREAEDLQRFKTLTADNPVQQRRAVELSNLWQQQVAIDGSTLQQHSAQRSSLLTGLLSQDSALATRIQNKVDQMRGEERRLLQVRTARHRQSQAWKRAALALGVLSNLLLLLWAYRNISEYAAAREAAEAELHSANLELESRVQERTVELQTANEHLSRSNQDLTRFAYVASHDLQEPLRTVGSYAGLLARRYQGALDDRADIYIGYIVTGAKRMQSMIQDLLLYSRTGTQQLSLAPVNLTEIVHQVKESIQITIAESHAVIEAENLPVVSADAGKLTLVLQNLIGNGIKFRSPERAPHVRITARLSGDDWFLQVSDNGIGFDPQYAERIFVIFQRLHGVGEYPGTGIGLAICKRIVEAHGGRIWAESTPGAGSRFIFSLPARQRSGPLSPAYSPEELPSQKG